MLVYIVYAMEDGSTVGVGVNQSRSSFAQCLTGVSLVGVGVGADKFSPTPTPGRSGSRFLPTFDKIIWKLSFHRFLETLIFI